MLLRSGLSRIVDLRTDERQPFSMMLLFALLLGFAQVYLSSAAIGLFLAEFPASMLPWGYVGIALSMPLLGLAYERLGRVLRFSRLLMLNLALMAISLCLFRALIDTGGRWVLLALYIWFVVVWGMLNLALWGLAGRLFNLRQGKRLFGAIGAGEMLAMILGGLSVAWLVHPFGAANLLLLSVAFIVFAMLVLRRICVTHRARVDDGGDADEPQPEGLVQQLKQRFLVLIFLSSGIAWLVFYVVDNAFFLLASERYTSEAALATLVGRLEAGVGVLLLFSRLLLTPWLLARFGVRAGLLAIPILVGLAAVAVVLAGNLGAPAGMIFGLAVVAKVLEESCRDSVFRSSLQMLYQPLSPARRLSAQTTTESIVDPLAAGVASALLLTLGVYLGFTPVQLFQVLLGLFALWIIVSLTLQPHYLAALRRALARRSGDTANSSFLEGASTPLLRSALLSPHANEVIYALGLLREADPSAWREALAELLRHPRSQIRHEALLQLAGQPGAVDSHRIRHLALRDPSPAVRGEAWCTLASLETAAAVEEIARALDDEEELVRRGAMVGLIRHGGIQGILLAGNQLLEQVRSTQPAMRRAAAEVVGGIGIPGFYHPLTQLLADSDATVAQAALEGAASLGSPELWPHVVPLLDRPALRGYAIDALRTGARAAAESVAVRMLDPQLGTVELSRMVRVLGVIDDPRAVELLMARVDSDKRQLREQVLEALVRQGPAVQAEQRAALLELIADERSDAVWLQRQINACRQAHELSLIAPLREQMQAIRRRILLLLQLTHDAEAMAQVRDRMDDPSSDRRAYALELLDNLLAPSLKHSLLPLFESVRSPALEDLDAVDSNLPIQQRRLLIEERAAAWGATWLQASTLCALSFDEREAASQRVQQRLDAREWLVREAAQWWLTAAAQQASAAQRSEAEWQFVGIQRVGLLRQVGILERASDSALADIAEQLQERHYARGEVIFNEGDASRSVHIIAAGSVGVFRNGQRLASLHAPDLFGEFALLDQRPRSAAVRADTQTRVYELAADSLQDLLFDQPDITHRLIALLAERLRTQPGFEQGIGGVRRGLDAAVDNAECPGRYRPDVLGRRLLLKSLPLFHSLPEALLRELAAALRPLSAKAGELVYREGEPGRSVFVVLSGQIVLSREQQSEAVVRGPRELFGDLSLLDYQPRCTTATALTDCALLRLDKEVLQDLLRLWPELSRSLLRDLVRRNRLAMAAP